MTPETSSPEAPDLQPSPPETPQQPGSEAPEELAPEERPAPDAQNRRIEFTATDGARRYLPVEDLRSSTDSDEAFTTGASRMTPGFSQVLADAMKRTKGRVVLTDQSIAEAAGIVDIDLSGGSGADNRELSDIKGVYNADTGDVVLSAGAAEPDMLLLHEFSHAVDHEYGRRASEEGGRFSDTEEFREFYRGVYDLYDGTGIIQNPDFPNRSLMKWYFLSRGPDGANAEHNGTRGVGEFFAEAAALAQRARAAIDSGEMSEGDAHFAIGRALATNMPTYDPVQPQLTEAGSRILEYFDSLDARMQSRSGDLSRQISTGKSSATKARPKNALTNPDATRAANLAPEEKRAMGSSLQEIYGIKPRTLVDNIIDTFRSASDDERKFGSRWYAEARGIAETASKGLRDKGLNLEKASAMLAALSPQTAWGANQAHFKSLVDLLGKDPVIGKDLLDKNITKSGPDPKNLSKSRVATRTVGEWMALEDAKAGRSSSSVDIDGEKRLSEYTIDEQQRLLKKMMTLDEVGGLSYPEVDTAGNPTGRTLKSAAPMKDNLEPALNIWYSDPGDLQAISSSLGGHKVRSFYNNIVNDDDAQRDTSVTIDTHALDLAIIGVLASRLGMKAAKGHTTRTQRLVKEYGLEQPPSYYEAKKYLDLNGWDGQRFTSTAKAREGTYAMFHDAFLRATEEINEEFGLELLPKQVQAITWLTALPESVSAPSTPEEIEAAVAQMNAALDRVKPIDELDIADIDNRRNIKDVPDWEEEVTADNVWLAPGEKVDTVDPMKAPRAASRKRAPAKKAAAKKTAAKKTAAKKTAAKKTAPAVPWNSLPKATPKKKQLLQNHNGVALLPMPEPGTPQFDALAEQIRAVHPGAVMPTGSHQAAFYNPNWADRDADLLWKGLTNANNDASAYSPRFEKRSLFKKFARNRALVTVASKVRNDLDRMAREGDMRAVAALLLMNTGMRVGSGKYGTGLSKGKTTFAATSLQPRHIYKHRGSKGYYWKFLGKSGTENTYDVSEPYLQELMEQWYTGGSGTDRIFPMDVNDASINDLLEELFGMYVKNHDMRTMYATNLAKRLIAQKRRPPRTPKEFSQYRLEVAKAVGNALNDKHNVALVSYIDWAVWGDWEQAAGLKPTLELDDSEIPGWDDVDNISLTPDTAETVVASAADDERNMSPAMDVTSPEFQDMVEWYQNNYLTVENPEIADPEEDEELQ